MTGIGTAVGAGNFITAIAMSRGPYNAATSSLFFGTSNGRVFRLDNPTGVAAATAPVEISVGGGFPIAYVSSIAVSPVNDDTVLVTFSNYGVTSVFWTNNANSFALVPTWQNVEGNLTLPSFRSSAIANIGGNLEYFVGTSAGLFRTTAMAGGATMWTQEGAGTLGNAIISSLDLRTSDNKLLVGTHGYGIWSALAPTAASATISGRVLTSAGRGLAGAIVHGTEQSGNIKTARTNSFGYYRLESFETGQTIVVGVNSKSYRFNQRVVNLDDSLTNIDFAAQDESDSKSQNLK